MVFIPDKKDEGTPFVVVGVRQPPRNAPPTG